MEIFFKKIFHYGGVLIENESMVRLSLSTLKYIQFISMIRTRCHFDINNQYKRKYINIVKEN